MYCFPIRRCFYEPIHGVHCFTTYHCIPPFPKLLTYPIPQGPTTATWESSSYEKCYQNCIEQGGYDDECKTICHFHHPQPRYWYDPSLISQYALPYH